MDHVLVIITILAHVYCLILVMLVSIAHSIAIDTALHRSDPIHLCHSVKVINTCMAMLIECLTTYFDILVFITGFDLRFIDITSILFHLAPNKGL